MVKLVEKYFTFFSFWLTKYGDRLQKRSQTKFLICNAQKKNWDRAKKIVLENPNTKKCCKFATQNDKQM